MDPKSITGEDEEVMWVEAEGEFSSAVTTRMIPDFPRAGFKRLLEGEWEKKKTEKKNTHTHIPPITTPRWALTSLLRTKVQIDIRYSKQQRTFSKQSVFWCLQIERD